MHVHELRVENFKRVRAVSIPFPSRGTVEICGRNGAGKSSVIDALWAALGGTKASPGQPVRNGSRQASVTLNLGDLRVYREWDARGTRLTVTDPEGLRVGRPQELLDSLFAKLAFDPMEFTRQKASEQAATLRKVTGLDFTALDQQRKVLYEERTDVGRAIKRQEAVLADMPEVEETAEVSAAALNAELQAASRHNVEVAAAERRADQKADEIEDVTAEIATLNRKLAAAKARLDEAKAAHAELLSQVTDEIDTAPILEQIATIEQTNRRARQYRERSAAVEALRANRAHSESLTDQIDDIDGQRQEMLSAARFPVPGLSLDGDGVTFGGVPFGQVSTAEQIRVSLAMSAALNPKLRLIVIKEGSLLDDSSLTLVAEWAQENGYQVVVERVADAALGSGVVIEEGLVKGEAELEPVG